MDPTSRLRLSLGFVSTVMSMIFGTNKGRKNLLSPGAIEILYSSYFSRICMGDIAGMLEISPSSATDLVNYLEREGYVRRVPDTENRRSIQVIPTEKGEEWILSTEEKIYGFLESGLSRLTPDEQKQFADLCTRFSGVHDTASFTSSLRTFRETGSQNRISLIQRRNGRLLRLEEVVDGRYAHSHETDIKEEQMTLKPRIPETSEGIQDEITVEQYDHMQRGLRDNGHLPVEELIRASKPGDSALEIGPGPGYFGLEWLKHTKKTHLTGLEISPAMIRMAEKNSKDYGLSDRSIYHEGNALSMPFADNSFDLAFSNGSLHEWEDPGKVFSEIFRVLKPGGELRVSDLRRDLSPEIYQFMLDSCKGPEIKKGFQTSVQAAYTKEELEILLQDIGFTWVQVIAHPYGLVAVGKK
ncbi:transcriptional regulator, MarR family [Methanospirillum hungatei JF-1]|jgi:ubiquinone/menaquinone biosynthesis C-methylase UbiE/DNA-binding MarR family transcriptional regulator|uniref:Transcriptional regulator, MarR family n=1 Tax=Methanospirillum hungatei JF-1 (strain ATCC 27890 / DSM 864 / NBRC 100397 / JF-1) TaxID=323259 RepID=Q2FMK7_METHJ|nr:methyltransferase domain-containing protein [Methanospirillum hungatei]ABD40025.1 transcriptional regulator, MarR family [Methanospirillum hungatei JF-1]